MGTACAGPRGGAWAATERLGGKSGLEGGPSMSWAARLASFAKQTLPDAVSVFSVDSPQSQPIDTIGTIDMGAFSENRPFITDPIERAAIQAEALPVRRIRKRPVSWARPDDEPAPGDYCGCCSGLLWWIDTDPPRGWRCACCYPPCHLQAGQFRAVAT